MRHGAVVRKIDGYIVVIDPCLARNGRFMPRYWIFGADNLAARPIAAHEASADYPDQAAAVAMAEELAKRKLAEMKANGRDRCP